MHFQPSSLAYTLRLFKKKKTETYTPISYTKLIYIKQCEKNGYCQTETNNNKMNPLNLKRNNIRIT